MESASRQALSEELKALGNVPSEDELSALIERYAGSRRVTCEQADLFFASIGETSKPSRRSDAAEVARGSWLDKLGPRSSAPPRSTTATQPPALSIATVASVHQEEPITIEQALEHLPAMTYSSAPPPSALPSEGSAPVALPLSSRPAPQMTAKDSVVVERWGMAETTPEPAPERWGMAEPAAAVNADEAEEDALLDQWSEELDRKLTESGRPGSLAAAPVEPGPVASTDAPERWSAPPSRAEAAVEPGPVASTDARERWSAPPSRAEAVVEPGPADARERWSAPPSSAEAPDAKHITHDDDAPLSAAELSLLDKWSTEEPAQPTAAAPGEPAPADTRRSSRAPRKRTQPPPLRPESLRPPTVAATQPPAAFAAKHDDAELDVELEEEIELEPDDLIEIDTE
ncbi:MAG TPA: hypothetical protein VFN67_28885 [Polyangiales bacterium]|nr:hypothetical protein [Polyangiales bacterium]